jgi:hypothetical protein
MSITKTKTIRFKIEDIASINCIMGERGTMLIDVTFCFIGSGTYDIPEYIYDGEYHIKWSSSSSVSEPRTIDEGLKDEVIELLIKSYYNERDAFDLNEKRLYDFSHFEKYDIGYMMNNDCSRVESLIALATQSFINAEITDKTLNADTVKKLVLDIASSFHKNGSNLAAVTNKSTVVVLESEDATLLVS